MSKRIIACLCLCFSFNAFTGVVQAESKLERVSAEIIKNLKQVRPDLPSPVVTPTDVPGIYMAGLPGGQALYFFEDGKRFFAGDLIEIRGNEFVNLAEEGRNDGRKPLMDQQKEEEMFVFSPPKELVKATVTVFTDFDCGYCRKLHQEVPELNRLGIAVRYMAYPRSGVGRDSYKKIVSAYCADDSTVAFTKAKMGQTIPEKTCDNPVAEQYRLGSQIGVNATPAIVFESGKLHLGYLEAKELAAELGIL